MKTTSGSRSSPALYRSCDAFVPYWPKCSAALAAVKDKPFGWRYAPSLTAAAHGENGPPCRNEGMDRATQAPSAPSPIASGPPKVPTQKPDEALKLHGRPGG